MDLEALALAVDELVQVPAAERRSGRLYAVRCTADTARSDDDNGSPPGSAAGVVLDLLAEGEARTLPQEVRTPAGVRALALASGVWVAPMDDDGGFSHRPSRHPQRRRAHLTAVVGVDGDRDAADVSVLRYGDGAPAVLRGGVGLVRERLIDCWSRRPDAPAAATGPTAAP